MPHDGPEWVSDEQHRGVVQLLEVVVVLLERARHVRALVGRVAVALDGDRQPGILGHHLAVEACRARVGSRARLQREPGIGFSLLFVKILF